MIHIPETKDAVLQKLSTMSAMDEEDQHDIDDCRQRIHYRALERDALLDALANYLRGAHSGTDKDLQG